MTKFSGPGKVPAIFLNVIIMSGYDHVWFKTHNILCVINSCGLNFFYDEKDDVRFPEDFGLNQKMNFFCFFPFPGWIL